MKNSLLALALICACITGYGQAPTLTLDEVLISSADMNQPWGMSFISEDRLLFTEKSGKLFEYVISTESKTEISGLPAIAQIGQGGLLDVAIHPDFHTNNYVYLSYSISGDGGYTLAVGRGVLTGNQLTNFTEIFRALPFRSSGNHFGSRITFDDDNYIYISSSDRAEQDEAQVLSNHSGKVIRLHDDGTVPTDNPFYDAQDVAPEIFSYGHRNIQGMVFHAPSGKVYAHEHGPKGGDELNVIEASKNYGWPEITFGVNYNGSVISEDTARSGMEQPIRYWVPSIAPCGMAIVPIAGQSSSEVDFILGALSGKQIQWVKIDADEHVETYSFMHDYARFRDVEVAPDGKIYALTESPNSLIRLQTNQVVTNVLERTGPQNKLEAYPNPVNDVLQINAEPLTGIKVYSLQGKMVQVLSDYRAVQIGESIQLDVSTLKTGIYLLELSTESATQRLKFVKL